MNAGFALAGSDGDDWYGISSGSAYAYSFDDLFAEPRVGNVSPSDSAIADTWFDIRWWDFDYNGDASVSLYYDTDGQGEDGTQIVSGLSGRKTEHTEQASKATDLAIDSRFSFSSDGG